MNKIMVDLETLGTAPGSVIVSIGAVFFDEYRTGAEFYVEINKDDSLAKGFTHSQATMDWWATQPPAARDLLHRVVHGGQKLEDALQLFSSFCMSSKEGVEIWGNGASFDNSLLAEAYRKLDMPPPWKFWNDRCHRTLKSLFREVEPGEFEGIAHHALHDALHQAQHASAILRRIKALQTIGRGINELMGS